MTARTELRNALTCGWSMDYAESRFRAGLFSEPALERFERIFAWATATDHPLTRHVPLARWSVRRERIRQAIRNLRTKEG